MSGNTFFTSVGNQINPKKNLLNFTGYALVHKQVWKHTPTHTQLSARVCVLVCMRVCYDLKRRWCHTHNICVVAAAAAAVAASTVHSFIALKWMKRQLVEKRVAQRGWHTSSGCAEMRWSLRCQLALKMPRAICMPRSERERRGDRQGGRGNGGLAADAWLDSWTSQLLLIDLWTRCGACARSWRHKRHAKPTCSYQRLYCSARDPPQSEAITTQWWNPNTHNSGGDRYKDT